MESLKRKAYEEILAKLLQNDVVAGQIINRRAVAAELGMSVAPVLEAMIELENEGFLRSLPRQGTQVRAIQLRDVAGMLAVPEAFECAAARLYSGARLMQAMDSLLPLARALDATAPGNPHHWEREIEFHGRLVDCAGVAKLSTDFRRCIRLNMFFAINRLSAARARKRDAQSHEELLQRLAGAHPDRAEAAVRGHIRSGKGRLELIESDGDVSSA